MSNITKLCRGKENRKWSLRKSEIHVSHFPNTADDKLRPPGCSCYSSITVDTSVRGVSCYVSLLLKLWKLYSVVPPNLLPLILKTVSVRSWCQWYRCRCCFIADRRRWFESSDQLFFEKVPQTSNELQYYRKRSSCINPILWSVYWFDCTACYYFHWS